MKNGRMVKAIAKRAVSYVAGTVLGMVVLDGVEKVIINDYKRRTGEQAKKAGITGGKTFYILNDNNDVIYTGVFDETTGKVDTKEVNR